MKNYYYFQNENLIVELTRRNKVRVIEYGDHNVWMRNDLLKYFRRYSPDDWGLERATKLELENKKQLKLWIKLNL